MTRQRVRECFCYLFKFVVKVKLYSYLYDDEEQKSQKIRSEWIVKGVFHVIFVSDKWNTCMHLCFHFFLGDYVSFIDVIVPLREKRRWLWQKLVPRGKEILWQSQKAWYKLRIHNLCFVAFKCHKIITSFLIPKT